MAASEACRPAPTCRGPLRRDSLAFSRVLDGEAYESPPLCLLTTQYGGDTSQ